MRGLAKNEIRAEVDKLLIDIQMTDCRHDQVVTLSHGMQKKLSLLLALIGKPKVKGILVISTKTSKLYVVILSTSTHLRMRARTLDTFVTVVSI